MESPDENPPKRAKLSEPPKHGQRLFFSAMLYWFDSQNQRVGNEVMLLLDSGCSGPILNQNFVQDHAVPWIRRGSPIAVNAADGRPMEDAGVRYTEDIVLRIGTHQEEFS